MLAKVSKQPKQQRVAAKPIGQLLGLSSLDSPSHQESGRVHRLQVADVKLLAEITQLERGQVLSGCTAGHNRAEPPETSNRGKRGEPGVDRCDVGGPLSYDFLEGVEYYHQRPVQDLAFSGDPA
jgi:hypothetical protein